MGLRQDLYEAIYDALTAAHLHSSTATVKSAFPDDDSITFPLVVVNPVDVDKDSFTFNRAYSTKRIRIMIDIWTSKNKDKDVIADEIDTVISSTPLSGTYLVGWSESNAVEPQGGNKLHLKSIILDFISG